MIIIRVLMVIISFTYVKKGHIHNEWSGSNGYDNSTYIVKKKKLKLYLNKSEDTWIGKSL